MTGIQALERIAPDLPVARDLIARLEYEYRRHGTIGLFGNLHVATGKIWLPMLRETRTEEDTLENLDNLINQDPTARFRLVMDNLNTHVSESFVRYIAYVIGYEEDLGKKGVRGILKSVATRSKFLSDPSHRVQLLFTPRHCSWLNQIELWFGTLRRKVTRTMSFGSLESLSETILRLAVLGRNIQTLGKLLLSQHHGNTQAEEPSGCRIAEGIMKSLFVEAIGYRYAPRVTNPLQKHRRRATQSSFIEDLRHPQSHQNHLESDLCPISGRTLVSCC